MQSMKLSRYIEEVPLRDSKNNIDMFLVYSTRTSKLVSIDSSSFQKIKQDQIKDIDNKVYQELIQAKILVNKQENELNIILEENKQAIENGDTLTVVIQPTANCSLGCEYCGQSHLNIMLTKTLQTKLVERIASKIIYGKHKTLVISWFGAEPLNGMKVIRSLSSEFQTLCKKNNLNYFATIVTNGLSLNEHIAYQLINEHQVNRIEITLDGTKEFHDQRRHLKNGDGTFDKIYNNILHLVKHYVDRIKLIIRCNVDDRNIGNVPQFIDLLDRDGILQVCDLYFAPIHSWGNDADKFVNDKKDWANQQIDWYIQIKNKNVNVRLLHKRKKNLCIAVDKNAELIDPYGNIYKCTEVSLVPTYIKNGIYEHKLGNLVANPFAVDLTKNKFGDFNNINTISEYPCHKCNLFPICGGMCPKEWKEGRIACPPIKFNIKERIMLEYLWSIE